MALSHRRGSSSESSKQPISTQRRGHDKQSIEKRRRCDSRSRRKSEPYVGQLARHPPPRQLQRLSQQSPSPLASSGSSTPSLTPTSEYSMGFAMERTPSGKSINSDNTMGFAMERTPSGKSIISDPTFEPEHDNPHTIISDEDAACSVKDHFRRLPNDSRHKRYLRSLIEGEVELDKVALDSVLTTVNSLFFRKALSGRVSWEWSHPSQQRYHSELIGSTALRPAKQGGYETLIVLSDPILNKGGYDRRFTLSAFLHELIHCYLFIRCGFHARSKGGHTKGFHDIAEIIDKWVGKGDLKLCNMKANLDHFRIKRDMISEPQSMEAFGEYDHNHDGCNQSPRPDGDYLEDSAIVRPLEDDAYI